MSFKILVLVATVLATLLLVPESATAKDMTKVVYRGPQSYPGYKPTRPLRPPPSYNRRPSSNYNARPVNPPPSYTRKPWSNYNTRTVRPPPPVIRRRPERPGYVQGVRLQGRRRNDPRYQEGLNELAGLMD